VKVSTATAIQPTTIFRIERQTMLRALHAQSELSEKFIASLLARNIDLEEDLGLIDYNGEITVRAELLTDVVRHD